MTVSMRIRAPLAMPRLRLRWVTWTFLGLLAAYAALTVAIVAKSPVLGLDADVVGLHLRQRYAGWYPWLHIYVMLGQRGPATLAALPWFAWKARRERSARPLVMLAVALIVLNASVGAVKILTGRLGPRGGHAVDQFFAGGDLYPSGHVANAVVLYGVIAILVSARYRPTMIAVAAFITLTIGISTLLLNTHWLTDVVGGVLAGGLVLCSLAWLVVPAERLLGRAFALRHRSDASEAVGDSGELLADVEQLAGHALVA